MSTTIDNKVVEMSFDNRNFEQNVKTSLGTLDKLKEALNFDRSKDTFKSLESAANNVNLSGIERGVEALQERFSALGIAGMEVLKRLTNAAMDLGSKLVKNTVGKIISGGYARSSNLQAAKFMLEGLNVEWKDILEDIEYGVNDTAYSLDAAAKVASSLVASGISIGDEMKTSLRGISGVAAMTNSSYEEIGQIFTTVAGQGKLMTMQLRQLELRGMNAAATIGKYMGATEAEVRDMVTKGVIDFQTFSQAMDDAFGEHAKASNETLTGVLANIGSALARVGQRFIEPIIRNNGPLIEFLNAIRLGINEINAGLAFLSDTINPKIESILSTLAKKAQGLLSGYNRFSIAIDKTGMSMNGFRTKLEDLFISQEKFGKYETAIQGTQAYKDKIAKATEELARFDRYSNMTSDELSALGMTADDVSREFDKFVDSFGGETAKQALDEFSKTGKITGENLRNFIQGTDAFKQSLSFLKLEGSDVASVLRDQYDSLKDLNDEQLKAEGYTREEVDALYELSKAFATNDEEVKQILDDITNGGTPIENVMAGLKGIFEAIKPVLSAISDAFKDIFSSKNHKSIRQITNAFRRWGESLADKVAPYVEKIGRAFSGLFSILDLLAELVKGVLSVAFRTLGAIFSSTSGGFIDLAANAGDVLTNFHNMVIEGGYIEKIFTKIGDAITFLIKKVKDLISRFKNFIGLDFGSVRDKIIDLGDKLKELLSGITLPNSKIDIFKSFNTSLDNTDKNSESKLKNITKNIGAFLSNIKEAFSSTFNISGDKVVALGSVIALIVIFDRLAKAIQLVADMVPNVAKIQNAITDLLTTLSKSVKKLARAKQFEIITSGLYNLAKSLLVIAASVALLSKLDYGSGNISKSLGILAGALVSLMVVSVLIGKFGKSITLGKTLSITALAIGLVTFMGALSLLAKFNINFGDLAKNLGIITYTFVNFAAILGLIKMINTAFGNSLKDLATLTLLPLSILAFVTVLKRISKLDSSDISILKIVGVLSAFLALTAILKLIMKDLHVVDTGILEIAAAVALLAIVVKQFKRIDDWKEAAGIATGLITVCALLYALVKVINKTIGKEIAKTSGILIEAAGAVVLLGIAVHMLKNIEPLKALKAVIAVGALLTALGAMFRIINGEIKGARGTIVTVGILIAELAAIVFAITLIDDQGKVKTAAVIVSGILLTLGLLLRGVASLGNSKWGDLAKSVLTLATIMAVVWGLSAIIKSLIQTEGIEKALDVCKGITMLLLSIAGTFAIIAVVGTFASGLVPAMGGFLLLLGMMFGVTLLLGELATWIPGLQDLLNNGIPVLAAIGQALGEFVGSLIGGIFSKLTQAYLDILPSLGESLSGFMENAGPFFDGARKVVSDIMSMLPEFGQNLSDFFTNGQGFFDGVKTLSTDVLKGTGILIGVMAELGAAAFVQNVQSFLGLKTDFEDLKSTLTGFGEAMSAFQKSLGDGFDASLVQKAATAGLTLTTLVKNLEYLGNGGIWGTIKGAIFGDDSTGEQFKSHLVAIGNAIGAFGNALGDVDGTLIEKAANAGQTLMSLMSNIGNQQIIEALQRWFWGGTIDYAAFIENMGNFAAAIKNFADTAATMQNVDTAEKAVNMAKVLVGLQKTLPKTSGVLREYYFGHTVDMATFGTQLEGFANSLVEFSNIVSTGNINYAAVEAAINCGKLLTELANGMPKYDGVIKQWFSKSVVPMDKFGDQLISFGRSMKTFITLMNGVSEGDVTRAKNLASAVTALANGLPSSNSVQGWIFGGNTKSLKSLGKQLEDFAGSMKKVSGDLAKVDTNKIINLATAIQKLLTQLNTAAANSDKYGTTMKSLGEQTAQGFINGVLAKLWQAAIAGSRLGETTKNSLKKALDIHSPSKVMEKLGGFTGQGFLNGLMNLVGQATVIFNNLKQVAISHFSGIIGDVANAFNAGIDGNALTITPVLDLSNIQNGIGDINSMFGNLDMSALSGSFDLAALTSNAMSGFNMNARTDMMAQSIFDQFKDFNAKDTIGSVTNTFNIQSSDPEGVADEVSKILNKQLERTRSTWA